MNHPRALLSTTRPHSRPDRRRSPLAFDEGLDWPASGWAGIAGGTAFILLETTMLSFSGVDTSADFVRRVAGIALGPAILNAPDSFTAVVFLAAMGVHLILSLFYARVLAVLVKGQSPARAVALGAGFGALLYAVNYYAFTGLFPWFAASRGWITLSAHVAFGTIAAYVYEGLTGRIGKRVRESPTII